MDAIEFLGNDVDQTRVKLVIDVPADEPVMAPPIGLTVALSCLIKNSMESMDGGSIMRVEFRAIRQTEDLVLVEIIDCGRGISEEMWAKVGHKMFSTKPSGVGFGLASAKWALKETGAGITIKSQGTGMGATASFTLARPISP
jgi:two-component system sensor histidine kinase DctS